MSQCLTQAEIEKMQLGQAVDDFTKEMKEILFQKVDDGYTGWDDHKEVSSDSLAWDIHEDSVHVVKEITIEGMIPIEHLIDIANRAMMLFTRGKNV